MRSEIQHQQHEVAELHLLEKKREREKARGEVDEDIQCRTKMGERGREEVRGGGGGGGGRGSEGGRGELVVMEDGRRRRTELKIRLRVWLAKLKF